MPTPSSSSCGRDCNCGAACIGGVMKKGNSCSGAAVAEAENATTPAASAPSATAARRVVSLNGFSMVVPCFSLFERQLNAPLRRVVNEISTRRGFPDVCFKSAKWFRGGENCFIAAVFDDTIGAVRAPALRSGMKNAAPRPGHGVEAPIAAAAAVFAAARQRQADATGRAGFVRRAAAIRVRRVAAAIRVVLAVSAGPVDPVADPAVAADPAVVDVRSAVAGPGGRTDFAGAGSAAG